MVATGATMATMATMVLFHTGSYGIPLAIAMAYGAIASELAMSILPWWAAKLLVIHRTEGFHILLKSLLKYWPYGHTIGTIP